MKRINLILSCILLGMIFTVGIGTAWGYFTTYAVAKGGYTIHLGDQTEIFEPFSNQAKHVQIYNEEGSEPVYVRVKAFSGDDSILSYENEEGGWILTPDSDGFYRYDGVVPGGDNTTELAVRVDFPSDSEDGDHFNVVVVYETLPVQYRSSGDIIPASEIDWHMEGGDR